MKRWIAAALLLCILCTGCGLVPLTGGFSDLPRGFSGSYAGLYQSGDAGKGVYDDDEKIADESENLYAEEFMVQNCSDSKKSAVEIRFAKFHGKQQCFVVNTEDEELCRITYELKLQKGRMKLVFVSEEGSVFPLAEGDAEDARDEVDWTLPKGRNRLLLVCDGAEAGEVRWAVDRPDCFNEGTDELEPVPEITEGPPAFSISV